MRSFVAVAAVLTLVGPAQAAMRSSAAATGMKAPADLHAFLPGYASDTNTFPRTPAFAWSPVRGAAHYQLVLSTSPLFAANGIVWNDVAPTTPVAAVPIALPWVTGTPHSLYARVRGINAGGGFGPWSSSYGFDMRWTGTGVPAQLSSPNGLVRWQPVDGATAYQVWFLNTNVDGTGSSKIFATTTNVADEREYYTFHQGTSATGVVDWRVRAVRTLYGATGNQLPAVSYGPWSPIYVNTNSAFVTGALSGLSSLAEPAGVGHNPANDGYQLTPGFSFTGNVDTSGASRELYRVYVFSDRDCVNPVFKGSVVGSPAYAPRISGVLKLPADMNGLTAARTQLSSGWWVALPDGAQTTYAVDGSKVDEREVQSPATFAPTPIGAAASGTTPASGGSTTTTTTTGSTPATGSIPSLTGPGAPIGLWDTNWPVGRYYWTVVPVQWYVVQDGVTSGSTPTTTTTGSAPTSPKIVYYDTELPQDVCGNRSASFGMASQAAGTVSPGRQPYAWGLSPKGTLRTASVAKPTFFGTPLVAWTPSLGATAYEVQWSRTAYPWKPVGNLYTFSTAATLPLKTGTWSYRVRGIDLSQPTGASTMAWSQIAGFKIAKPKFKIVGG